MRRSQAPGEGEDGYGFVADEQSADRDRATSRDPLYLFACHLEWRDQRSLPAYQELIAALDDRDEGVRAVAKSLLRRSSTHPEHSEPSGENEGWW